MADDIEKINQLVKAKTSSLQKASSNIISRGLSDLSLLTRESDDLKYTQSDAKDYVDRGLDYAAKGQYDMAIEDYDKGIALYRIMPNPISVVGWLINTKVNMTGLFLISKRLVIWGMNMDADICNGQKRGKHYDFRGDDTELP